ncbi:MAG: methanol--corrinoid methyltransferase [Clostridia bacterium]|nr:methanol--corrinoid methyltransferase [Clostridia bacterium]NCC76614.1 methanol--corrinoid methyltransferase [Clostridia bacterium]
MALKTFNKLAYQSVDDFIYGQSPHPVTLKNGLVIGGGEIYPEINFTLPPMLITQETMPEVLRIYKEIITGVTERAIDLYVPGFVAEVELLPPCTWNVGWGVDVSKILLDTMNELSAKYNIKTALRTTVIDVREGRDLEHMYRGKQWENVLAAFRENGRAGTDLLAIESIGGKDVHDEANVYCDIRKAIFALGVLGVRDMHKLWTEISTIARETGSIASGDTACGFANTAMVLADRKMIPKTFAAVDRVVSAVRSLAAIEAGAVGPHKDCGYEGVYVKAITGTPITMEGRTSAVAHLSPVGNIAACVADLWSNESIQHIKLLGGFAPVVSMEQLAYDCRLMNGATRRGPEVARLLRDLHADSDSRFDPQAYVLRPDVVFEIAEKIVSDQNGGLSRAKTAAQAAVDALRSGLSQDKVLIEEREKDWLDILESQIESIPDSDDEFIAEMVDDCEKFNPKIYDLA